MGRNLFGEEPEDTIPEISVEELQALKASLKQDIQKLKKDFKKEQEKIKAEAEAAAELKAQAANFAAQAGATPHSLSTFYQIRDRATGKHLYYHGATVRFFSGTSKKQGKCWKSVEEAKKFLARLLEPGWNISYDGAWVSNKQAATNIIMGCEIVERRILETKITDCAAIAPDIQAKKLAAKKEALVKQQKKLQEEIDALAKKD